MEAWAAPPHSKIDLHQYAGTVVRYENPVVQQWLAALLTALESTERRLRQLGDDHWADWLRCVITHVLRAVTSMASST
ncbi:hypothetical protein Acy02nite_75920 [Actinoplanes cyaneus]|uniref:Uncharacterized protein n=1 Tax=Actinoplanes cyaneus TaxID=52696 RepID=A0A919MFZ9_9ACTN|nr:hypothetical protein Acy02nite_75920 [Actinoplanes cyaneus]